MGERTTAILSTEELTVVLAMRQSHTAGRAIYRYARSYDQPDDVDVSAPPFTLSISDRKGNSPV